MPSDHHYMASSASQPGAFHLFLNASFFFLALFYLVASRSNSSSPVFAAVGSSATVGQGCDGLHGFETFETKCRYLVSDSQCRPEGYIDYLHLFYCICGESALLGYSVLLLWLVLLFYLLGNTTASYFCSNLESLSKLLRLSPAVAGVTLLSLGNGASDVFSSVVSFMGSSSTNLVGLNCVLGGVFFVSTVVVGVISICTAPRKVAIDRFCFVRDVCFLLFVLLVLLVILVYGKINLWIAVGFSSLYLVYVLLVSAVHLFAKEEEVVSYFDDDLLLPTKVELAAPLLEIDKRDFQQKPNSFSACIRRIIYFLELPLYLPRRLTIPDISEERWCKPFAVTSVTLSPVLLASLWDSKREEDQFGSEKSFIIYLFAALLGVLLGVAVMSRTENDRPPARFRFLWLAGGFLMSVTWTYILARELVSLLVSVGVILDISPAILGLTVLAWGNSLGDLIANVAVAVHGGTSGAQVAVSGCYGGPIFNTLVGLGVSFVFSSWGGYPASRDIPRDPMVFQTMGFLFGGLLWALIILPKRGMVLDRVLGSGLICIYLCFLSVSVCQSLGLIKLQ